MRLACTSLALIFFAVSGCAPAVTNFAYTTPQRHAPKPDDAYVELYEAPGPDEAEIERPFEVIARFEVKQRAYVRSGLIEKARQRAREVGGDAIVVAPAGRFAGSDLFDLDRLVVWVVRYSGS